MKSRMFSVLFFSFFSVCLSITGITYASEGFEDGFLWLTKDEIRAKLGTPDYIYCEEEPYRRYRIEKPENLAALEKTFLYDVPVHDLYYLKRNNANVEFRVYYGIDKSHGQNTQRVREYTVKFLGGPVALGDVIKYVPEFQPAYDCSQVFLEHLFNYDNLRIIFVTQKVTPLSLHFGSIFVDPDKDIQDWSLTYDVILISGEPENVTPRSMVKEVVISVDGEYRIGKTSHVFQTKLIENPLQ